MARPARVVLDLVAQPPHVDVDQPLVADLVLPHAAEQLLARQDLAGVLGQFAEQPELRTGDRHHLAVQAHLARLGFEDGAQPTHFEDWPTRHARAGFDRTTLWARNAEAGSAIAERDGHRFSDVEPDAADLLVNVTPLGMAGPDEEALSFGVPVLQVHELAEHFGLETAF